MNSLTKRTRVCLTAIALLTLGAVSGRAAVAPPAPTKIGIRAVSPQDIKDYGLTGKQGSSGLSTVGIGQPAYLELMVPLTFNTTNLVSVEWSLGGKPIGSAAELVESPLGSNVPLGQPSDRLTYWLGDRRMLKPDLEGAYTVNAKVTYVTGVSNVTQKIVAGRFLGWSQGCVGCHSGGLLAQNMSSFTNTAHATAFQRKIDGSTSHFGTICIPCHSVGYDTDPAAVNGGWDDVAKETGWVFPATLTNGNWAAMPAKLKNVSNIQCENCHGPGNVHVLSDGVVGNTNAISVSFNSGMCGQCHDSKPNDIQNPEWNNSLHAITVTSPSGPGREGCVPCHTGRGFVANISGVSPLPTAYEPIGCATCHDPHTVTGEDAHQLRALGDITLLDGTTISGAGNAAICMNCHHSRADARTYVENTTGSSRFGPHHSVQADMLAGANAITYGKVIPSSAHGKAVEESCVHCHMQTVAATDPGFALVGGHTFNIAADTSTNRIELTKACTECHGDIENFNLLRQDYDGNGVVEGVQVEVQNLLNKVAALLPPVGPKSSISIDATWTKQQLRAGFNYLFVHDDGSFGVHNAAYAVGLLKASIADLTGDSNGDGLPDAWQIQYFGSANSPDAAPNATPANDDVPNWLKYSLGLDPKVPGIVVPGGVVWANDGSIGGSTNTIQIYTAAEVVFNTEVGKKYQLQSISSVNEDWSNVGGKIDGTGSSMSFVTPTRKNPTQFFRVVSE